MKDGALKGCEGQAMKGLHPRKRNWILSLCSGVLLRALVEKLYKHQEAYLDLHDKTVLQSFVIIRLPAAWDLGIHYSTLDQCVI